MGRTETGHGRGRASDLEGVSQKQCAVTAELAKLQGKVCKARGPGGKCPNQ